MPDIFRLFRQNRRHPDEEMPPMADVETPYELIMYSRSAGCPYVSLAKRVLKEEGVPYREIMIDRDPQARDLVVGWTGFQSVPTLVAALPGSNLPHSGDPEPLPQGSSPRGIHRGAMITEPSAEELRRWLRDNGFLA
jgi:glutaredoxin